MPIYEYVCRECGKELERLQRLADEPLTQCPDCGESGLKRKISAAGFRLSGTGWYETDFKSSGQHNLAGGHDAQAAQNGAAGGKGDAKSGANNAQPGASNASSGKSGAAASGGADSA